MCIRDSFNIVCVGTLNENKNQSLVLEAVKELKAIRVQFIGDGPLRNELENTVKEYGLSQIIYFKGNISNDLVLKNIMNADVMVLPSKYDGWGAVVNEALSVG